MEKRKCPQCGILYDFGQSFCGNCGENLKVSSPQVAQNNADDEGGCCGGMVIIAIIIIIAIFK